jgi:hypothetical protein
MLKGPLQIAADSTTTAITTTQTIAIPNNSRGEKPRYVYLASSAACSFRPCASGGSGDVTKDARLTVSFPLVVNVGGYTHIAFVSYTGTANVTITPLDNQ